MTTVILGIGANIGDRVANLRDGLAGLAERGLAVTQTSSLWETPPMPADQPWYYNGVVVAETGLSATAVLDAAKEVERLAGRRPNRRWGPRPLDVDILFFGTERIESERLTVPHPGITERGFVLAPLAEAWPGELPVLGERALDYLARVDRSGLARIGAFPRP